MAPRSAAAPRFAVYLDGDRSAARPLPASPDPTVVVAVDGGARHARRLGVPIDHAIGDFDSLDPAAVAALRAGGTTIHRHPADKDETDFELALGLVASLAAAGATARPEVWVTGGAGGRLDHILGNLAALAGPLTEDLAVTADLGDDHIVVVRPAQPVTVALPVGVTVSLHPMHGPCHGVTTSGLAYALDGATLQAGRARGQSNVVQSSPVTVAVRTGVLLLIHPSTDRRGAIP